jgi:hypothetical protein
MSEERLRGRRLTEEERNYAKLPLQNSTVDIRALRQALSALRLHERLINRTAVIAGVRDTCATDAIVAIERIIDNANRGRNG